MQIVGVSLRLTLPALRLRLGTIGGTFLYVDPHHSVPPPGLNLHHRQPGRHANPTGSTSFTLQVTDSEPAYVLTQPVT